MAAIYVSTYGKYNSGSLFGEWVELEKFNSEKEFYDYCRELHKDEDDPEFMFQDWEDIPRALGGEWMDISKVIQYLKEFSEDERKIIDEYLDEVDGYAEPSKILEAFAGEQRGEVFAEELCEECGDLKSLPNWLRYHIDWQGVWRELTFDGYAETTNYCFYPL